MNYEVHKLLLLGFSLLVSSLDADTNNSEDVGWEWGSSFFIKQARMRYC
jgi:hypothetical protein